MTVLIGGIAVVLYILSTQSSTTMVENPASQNQVSEEAQEVAKQAKWDVDAIKDDPKFIELMEVKAEQRAIELYLEDRKAEYDRNVQVLTTAYDADRDEAQAEIEAQRAREIELTEELQLSLQ